MPSAIKQCFRTQYLKVLTFMKNTLLAILLIGSASMCVALPVANAPILFKGMDEVPLASICKSGSIFFMHDFEGNIGLCTPSVDEYVGEKLIRRSKDGREFFSNYSHVEYDLESKKVMSINFVMGYDVFERVKEILEIKYGKAQKDSRAPDVSYWYGDKNGNALMYLGKSEPKSSFLGSPASDGQTDLVIITSAMRKIRAALESRELRARQEKIRKAVKDL